MSKADIVKEWIFLADSDLNSAVFLKGMFPVPIEIICYHCQQCAEKYLKAFLAFNDELIIKTHDLTILNKMCNKINAGFSSIEEQCLRLTDYSTNVRYPTSLDINENDMNLAIIDATKIKIFINNLINN
ncbi:MAG: hypothetical protein A2033_10935 [Bacteroidetes bacterium GWA2_31_9]|nr:MAG: hypothetical protein A2033_10935 [Bacteroidetes bacterium GWA2_31_9]